MKLIALGDTHGRSFWKLIIAREKPDIVVFIGDYFDTRENFTAVEEMRNFEDIIDFKLNPEKYGCKAETVVILLIGNHDLHYFPEIGYNGTSGYQSGAAVSISHLINEHRDKLQMAYVFDNYLFTHAGVCVEWLKMHDYQDQEVTEFINDQFRFKPKSFNFNGWESSGDNIGQTPVWIRPRSLVTSGKFSGLKDKFIQIVGHTTMRCIDIKGKATGGRYYFIDTLGTSGEYLIIENGEISVNKV